MRYIKKHLPIFSLLILITSTLASQPNTIDPVIMESIEIKNYLRVYGGPAGSFYLLRKGNIEIKRYDAPESFVRKLARGQKLLTSAGGRYFALIKYKSLSPTTLKVEEIALYSNSGSLIWKKHNPGCNSFILCDAAPVAVGIDGAEGLAESTLKFFDREGNTAGSVAVSYLSHGSFNRNGNFFFAISGGNGLLQFSLTGELATVFPECSRYHVSDNGNLVATSQDSLLRVYRDSEQVHSRAIGLTPLRDLTFSGDGKAMALLFPDRLELIDLVIDSILWQFDLPQQDHAFVGLDTDSLFDWFICASNNSGGTPEERNTKGEIILLDQQGQSVWNHQVSYSKWSIRYPEVRFNFPARLFSLLTTEKLEVYRF